MQYEDTYRVRQLNDIKVQHETQTISSLVKCLSDSNEGTGKMATLLDNFQFRLTALNDLIVPIYDTTNILQTKYSSKLKFIILS